MIHPPVLLYVYMVTVSSDFFGYIPSIWEDCLPVLFSKLRVWAVDGVCLGTMINRSQFIIWIWLGLCPKLFTLSRLLLLLSLFLFFYLLLLFFFFLWHLVAWIWFFLIVISRQKPELYEKLAVGQEPKVHYWLWSSYVSTVWFIIFPSKLFI